MAYLDGDKVNGTELLRMTQFGWIDPLTLEVTPSGIQSLLDVYGALK